MGRRARPIDPAQVETLAIFGCTNKEIAAFFKVTPSSISKRFKLVLRRGREQQKIRLRKAQWEAAVNKGSVPMLIFLGKNVLGQSDKQDLTGIPSSVRMAGGGSAGEGGADAGLPVDLSRMSVADLEAFEALVVRYRTAAAVAGAEAARAAEAAGPEDGEEPDDFSDEAVQSAPPPAVLDDPAPPVAPVRPSPLAETPTPEPANIDEPALAHIRPMNLD